ncbi:MAG: hypothetical protein M1834_003991 [Cirrosporium novae-zelandiae]|nr:MAG: hypothetical protein M1834_003991 [Cirrosporium novae-zelandiae]
MSTTTLKHQQPSSSPNSPIARPPQKKQKMSITQTYYLAHTARGKLSKEAAQPDHNLRLLVGHANLLDSLMLDLAEAEREQEQWFNQTVRGAQKEEEQRHIQWAETIVEDPEDEFEVSDSESESDSDDEEEEEDFIAPTPRRRAPTPTAIITETEVDEDDDMEEDDEDQFGELALQRTHSHPSPPELLHADSDSDSDSDDAMPLSPPQPSIESLTEQQRQAIATTSLYQNKSQPLSEAEQASFVEDGYFLPQRDTPTVVSAY